MTLDGYSFRINMAGMADASSLPCRNHCLNVYVMPELILKPNL